MNSIDGPTQLIGSRSPLPASGPVKSSGGRWVVVAAAVVGALIAVGAVRLMNRPASADAILSQLSKVDVIVPSTTEEGSGESDLDSSETGPPKWAAVRLTASPSGAEAITLQWAASEEAADTYVPWMARFSSTSESGTPSAQPISAAPLPLGKDGTSLPEGGTPDRFAGAGTLVVSVDPTEYTCFGLIVTKAGSVSPSTGQTCVPTAQPAGVSFEPDAQPAPSGPTTVSWDHDGQLVAGFSAFSYRSGESNVVLAAEVGLPVSTRSIELDGDKTVCVGVVPINAVNPVKIARGDIVDPESLPGLKTVCPWSSF